MQGIHPVFHISMLEPQNPNPFLGCDQPPPPPVEVDGKMEFEIKEILDSKMDCQCKDQLCHLIAWLGYEDMHKATLWIRSKELGHALDLVLEFHRCYPEHSKQSD